MTKIRPQGCQHVQHQGIKMFLCYSGCLNIPFWEINDSKQDVKDTRITKRKHFSQIFGKTLVGIGNRDK